MFIYFLNLANPIQFSNLLKYYWTNSQIFIILVLKLEIMKTIIKILLVVIILYSCDKDEPIIKQNYVDVNLVENYTYDTDGVVFKITNDIKYAFNLDFDSLALAKFHFETLYTTKEDLFDRESYTWIPYGHHVNWRYNYTGEKQITIIPKITEDTLVVCMVGDVYFRDPSEIDTDWFQKLFPYPVNDTVYVSISNIIDDITSNY